MPRGRAKKTQAAIYQARLELTRRAVDAEVEGGNLRGALRMVLGFAEEVALEGERARKAEKLRYERTLTRAEHARLRAAWVKVVSDVLGEVGLWLPDGAGWDEVMREAGEE